MKRQKKVRIVILNHLSKIQPRNANICLHINVSFRTEIKTEIPDSEQYSSDEPQALGESDDEPLSFFTPKQLSQAQNKSTLFESTFDGNWSSDDQVNDLSDFNLPDLRNKTPSSKANRLFKTSHRTSSGRHYCKYCESEFSSYKEKDMHFPVCEYLQCDQKKFICRICKKQLSKESFKNHIHDSLSCKKCNKKFVNPRSMKAHMKKKHEIDISIRKYDDDHPGDKTEAADSMLAPLEIGYTIPTKRQRQKKPRRTEKVECGKLLKPYLCFML